jgi:hypothetical protein
MYRAGATKMARYVVKHTNRLLEVTNKTYWEMSGYLHIGVIDQHAANAI